MQELLDLRLIQQPQKTLNTSTPIPAISQVKKIKARRTGRNIVFSPGNLKRLKSRIKYHGLN